ncbi:hypothetical protein AB0J25_17580 [Streptomyces sp. NPDC049910]|uniref:hypothetical protein n=1 Tax=Streptomyces sp. NPDC049910 TaxID=3155278 RepID=UPI00342615AB
MGRSLRSLARSGRGLAVVGPGLAVVGQWSGRGWPWSGRGRIVPVGSSGIEYLEGAGEVRGGTVTVRAVQAVQDGVAQVRAGQDGAG